MPVHSFLCFVFTIIVHFLCRVFRVVVFNWLYLLVTVFVKRLEAFVGISALYKCLFIIIMCFRSGTPIKDT